jgi:shikimate kinase
MYYSILFCFKFEGINNVILNNKIVLIGYMGSGKTAVGKELSKIFNIPFIDLDDEIVKVEKRSIDKIFEENGELYFRKVEHDCLKNILKSSVLSVISLGGGTPCYYNTIKMLNDNDKVNTVFLRASVNNLVERLSKEINHRPKIKNLKTKTVLSEFIGKHLFERNHFYNKSKFIINTNNKSINAVAKEIELFLN